MEKHKKMCIKSEFKEIFLKLILNGQSDKAFLLTSKFCPQGIVYPCPGAIYIYKSIKIYTRTRCQVSVYRTTGPVVSFIVFKFLILQQSEGILIINVILFYEQ